MGAGGCPARVEWRPGMGLGDYRTQAGGVTEQGDRGRASVTYANGERKRSDRFLFFRMDPDVQPGSTITVPVKQPKEGGGFNTDQWLTRMLSIATILVAIDRIN